MDEGTHPPSAQPCELLLQMDSEAAPDPPDGSVKRCFVGSQEDPLSSGCVPGCQKDTMESTVASIPRQGEADPSCNRPDVNFLTQMDSLDLHDPSNDEAQSSVNLLDLDASTLQESDPDQSVIPSVGLQAQEYTDTPEEEDPRKGSAPSSVNHSVPDSRALQDKEPSTLSVRPDMDPQTVELAPNDEEKLPLAGRTEANSLQDEDAEQVSLPNCTSSPKEEERRSSGNLAACSSPTPNSPEQGKSSTAKKQGLLNLLVWVTVGKAEHPAYLLTPLNSEPNVKIRWLSGQGTIETVPAASVRMDPGWSESRQRNTRSSARVSQPIVVTPMRSVLKRGNLVTSSHQHNTRSSNRIKSATPTLGRRMPARVAKTKASTPTTGVKTKVVTPKLGKQRSTSGRTLRGNGKLKTTLKDRNVPTKQRSRAVEKRKEPSRSTSENGGHAEADRRVKRRDENCGPNLVYLSDDSEDESVHQYWEVERVLEVKVEGGVEKFLIKWAGTTETTWEPEEHLCESVLKDARAKFRNGQALATDADKANIISVDFERRGYCSDDSEDEVVYWEVEKILKRKTVKGEEFFLVAWKGEGIKPTWEPADNLCDTAIDEAREKFCDDEKDDDIPFTLTTTAHVLENFKEIPQLEGKVIWQNEPTPETSVNMAYILASEAEKKTPSRRWPTRKKPKVLELFAGIGGMSLGFLEAAFETKWLVEKNSLAALRQKLLHPDALVYEENVGTFLEKAAAASPGYPCAEQVDHVHASPPCQGFSRANRWGGNQLENNKLCFSFVRAVKIFKPITATLENVEGMFQTKHLSFLQRIIEKLVMLDYHVRISVLDSSSYGDPQRRKRLFLFASSKAWPLPSVPLATHGIREGLNPLVSVRDALSDLEHVKQEDGNGLIFSKEKELVHNHQITESISSNTNPKARLDPDKPCGTILTGSRQFHYKLDRVLSVREVARLQSFPDSFQFFGTNTEQYAQLGNAVPVKLATAVAKSVAATYGK